jgi:hypothetical protein
VLEWASQALQVSRPKKDVRCRELQCTSLCGSADRRLSCSANGMSQCRIANAGANRNESSARNVI